MHQNAGVYFSCTTALLIGFQILTLDQHIRFEILIVYTPLLRICKGCWSDWLYGFQATR